MMGRGVADYDRRALPAFWCPASVLLFMSPHGYFLCSMHSRILIGPGVVKGGLDGSQRIQVLLTLTWAFAGKPCNYILSVCSR